MRKLFKVLFALFGVLIATIAVVFGINRYNTAKYATAGPDYTDPQVVLAEGNASLVEGDYLRGFHFPPTGEAKPGTIVVFGGSDGTANNRTAKLLQEQGYNVLALYFYGQPGQQEALVEAPLDFFDEALAWIETNANPEEPLTILGASKGAELVANLAARYPEVDNFVAYTPSEYTYQGITFGQGPPSSSFTYQGQPVPYLVIPSKAQNNPTIMTRLALGLPVSFRPIYEAAVESATEAEREAARINLSDFKGNGILFAGDQDAIWQGDIAAKNLADQNPNIEAFIYPDAGHVFLENITWIGPSWEVKFGGTVEGNRLANEKSQQVLMDKLDQWHTK